MRSLALGVPSLLATVLVTSGASALAASDGVDVTWDAPRGCPSSADLQERVTARLPGPSAVRARGRVERASSSTWRLALDIETPSSRGERTIEAPTCDALASSAAVVIAMSIAPTPEAPPAAPASAPLSLTSAPPAPPAPPALADRAAGEPAPWPSAALRSGDSGGALRLAAEHQRRFPQGVLVEEREGARVVARCSSGRGPSASDAATALLATHPRSPMRARINAACGTEEVR